MIISKYALEYLPYNETNRAITWENCTLRTWLNKSFLNEAFSTDEAKMIPTVTVSADINPKEDTDPGNDTRDKIFLLSYEEASKYFSSDTARQCKETAYVQSKAKTNVKDIGTSFSWWLRTPGYEPDNAYYVFYDGAIHWQACYVGSSVDSSKRVRPALWIDLDYLLS